MICNFADDNSLYTSGKSLEMVRSKLKHDTSIVLDWFSSNSMVANLEKFQIMFLGIKDNTNLTFEINAINILAKRHGETSRNYH